MRISDRFERWKEAAAGGALCGPGGHAVAGWQGTAMPHLHIPPAGELFALGALVAGFAAAAVWMFRRFGDRSADTDADRGSVPASPAELDALVADERPASEEREPVGV